MAETSLRAYIHQLEGLLTQHAYPEAIAHCRHILQGFPQHLDTYRILGKALLESDQHQDAADVFIRVLSIDPSDFVAHAGLSIVYEQDEAIGQAIWHMRRALEISPNNDTIQRELRRLLASQSGHETGRLELTRGALARLYARGGLHEQAIAELTRAITEEPDRVDLLSLLTETLLNAQQEIKAGDAAARLLGLLPYSLLANQVLATLWLKQDDLREAEPFLSRIDKLSPYLGLELRQPDERVPDETVMLEALVWSPDVAAASTGAVPDWVTQLGQAFGAAETAERAEGPASITDIFASAEPEEPSAPASPDDVPEWLAQMEPAAREPASDDAGAAQPPTTSRLAEAAADAPDWLSDIVSDLPVTGELEGDVELPQAGIDVGDVPDWLTNIVDRAREGEEEAETTSLAPEVMETQPEESVELPAGPGGTRPMDAPPEPAATRPVNTQLEPWDPTAIETWSTDELEEPVDEEPAEESFPAWLQNDELEVSEAQAAPAEDEAPPDWLEDAAMPPEPGQSEDESELALFDRIAPDALTPEEVPDVSPSPIPSGEEEMSEEEMPDWMKSGDMDSDDAMAWLEGLAARQGADPEELVTVQSQSEESEQPAPTPAPTPTPTAEAEDDLDWLRQPTETAPEPMDEASEAEEEMPDWLDVDEEPEEEAAVEDVEAEDDIPDWLRVDGDDEEEPEPVAASQPEADEAIPDWLLGDAGEDEEEAEPVAEQAAVPQEASFDLPDWLGEDREEPDMPAPAAAAEPATPLTPETDDAMAWLDGLATEQGAEADTLITEQLEDEALPAAAMEAADEVPEAEPGEVPDWLMAEVGKPVEEEEAPPAEPAPAPTLDEASELDWLSQAVQPEMSGEDSDLADFLEQNAPETLPPAPEPQRPPAAPVQTELPDWMRADSEAEEEEDLALADFLSETPSPSPTEAPSPPPPTPEPVPAAPAPPPPSGDVSAQLAYARQNLASDRVTALDAYEELIGTKSELEDIIGDLREVVDSGEPGIDPRVRRLLGDALMAEGRVQEALDTYRSALDDL